MRKSSDSPLKVEYSRVIFITHLLNLRHSYVHGPEFSLCLLIDSITLESHRLIIDLLFNFFVFLAAFLISSEFALKVDTSLFDLPQLHKKLHILWHVLVVLLLVPNPFLLGFDALCTRHAYFLGIGSRRGILLVNFEYAFLPFPVSSIETEGSAVEIDRCKWSQSRSWEGKGRLIIHFHPVSSLCPSH